MSYPASIDTFTTKVNGGGSIIDCSDVNNLQLSVLAIENQLLNGPMQLGTSYTNPFAATFYIAANIINNPVNLTEGIYLQHRIGSNLGAFVHDALASELRLYAGTNSTYLNAIEASIVINNSGNTLGDMRGLTANLTGNAGATGTIASVSLIRGQTVGTLPGGLTITGILASVVAEAQTVGATNYSFYSPGGTNYLGGPLIVEGMINKDGVAGSARDVSYTSSGSTRWLLRCDSTTESGADAGSNFALVSRHDDGSLIGNAFTVTRSTLAMQLGGNLGLNSGNSITLAAGNIITDTTTGTIIGTQGGASGQKLGFWAKTPIVQPVLATGAAHTVDDVITFLQNLGLARQS